MVVSVLVQLLCRNLGSFVPVSARRDTVSWSLLSIVYPRESTEDPTHREMGKPAILSLSNGQISKIKYDNND